MSIIRTRGDGVKGEHRKDKDVKKDIENLSKAVQALTDNISSRLKDRDGDDNSDGAAPRINCCRSADEMQSERDDDRLKDGGRVRKVSKARSKGKTLRVLHTTTTTTSSSAASSLPTQTMAMNLDKLLSEAHRCNIIGGGTSETLKTEVETAVDGSQVLHITMPLQHDVGSGGGKQSSRKKKKKHGTLTARDASTALTTQSSSCVTSADPVWSGTNAANTCRTESSVSMDPTRDRKLPSTRAVVASSKQAAKGRAMDDAAAAMVAGDPPVWEMHLSKNGRPFFHNNM